MSYNLGMILSMLFVVSFVLLGGDMFCIQSAYGSVDNASIAIGYLIAKSGRTDNEFLLQLETKYNVTFENINPISPQIGEVVDFTIYRMYSPLILSSNEVKLVASRSTVIGYYGWKKGGKAMSEIKGQLLGIILVLVIFGGISVAMATVFKNTAEQVSDKSEDLGKEASQTIAPSGLLHY